MMRYLRLTLNSSGPGKFERTLNANQVYFEREPGL